MEAKLKPSRAEVEFLTLAYNKFYDIFEEVISDSFWEENSYYRFSKIKDEYFGLRAPLCRRNRTTLALIQNHFHAALSQCCKIDL